MDEKICDTIPPVGPCSSGGSTPAAPPPVSPVPSKVELAGGVSIGAFDDWWARATTHNADGTVPTPTHRAAWLASRTAALTEAASAVPLPDRYGDNEFVCAGRRDMWSIYQDAILALIVDNPPAKVVNPQAKG